MSSDTFDLTKTLESPNVLLYKHLTISPICVKLVCVSLILTRNFESESSITVSFTNRRLIC